MKLRRDTTDIWIFQRYPDAVRYLRLHTCRKKGDRWWSLLENSRGGLGDSDNGWQPSIVVCGGANKELAWE